jgi:hypothetical protein
MAQAKIASTEYAKGDRRGLVEARSFAASSVISWFMLDTVDGPVC